MSSLGGRTFGLNHRKEDVGPGLGQRAKACVLHTVGRVIVGLGKAVQTPLDLECCVTPETHHLG